MWGGGGGRGRDRVGAGITNTGITMHVHTLHLYILRSAVCLSSYSTVTAKARGHTRLQSEHAAFLLAATYIYSRWECKAQRPKLQTEQGLLNSWNPKHVTDKGVYIEERKWIDTLHRCE